MKQSDKSKMDSMVQILRIIGAFMVIGTHIKVGNYVEGVPSYSRTVISCFVGDGVAVFWMILGFFYFKNNDYKRKISVMIKKIIIPMFLYSLIMFYFYDFIIGNDSTILESIRHSKEEYIYLIKDGLLKWRNVVPGAGHFWYLYVYALVVICYPALSGIKQYCDSIKNGQIKLIIIMFSMLIFNDLSFNGFFEFSHHTFGGMIGGAIWVLIGDIVYRNREKINFVCGIMGLTIFVGINFFRAFIQYKCYFREDITDEPLFWYTSYAVISVLGISMFVFGCLNFLDNTFFSIIINHIGKMTFPVYIVHMCIRDFLNSKGYNAKIILRFGNGGLGILKYEIVYTLMIFLLSLFVSELLFLIKLLIKTIIKK